MRLNTIIAIWILIQSNILFGQGNGNSAIGILPEQDNDNVEIFVELKTPPLALQTISNNLNRKNNLKPNNNFVYQEINSEHTNFIESIMKIEASVNIKTENGSTPMKILSEHKTIINGISLSIPKSYLSLIRSLPEVKNILNIGKYKITEINKSAKVVDDSINQTAYLNTGITKIRNLYGLSGKNVKVAILDSGIDYNLDCLGGGFGNKVIGGFDFADNDSDPMDHESHGTAVASILAGNSIDYQGVAPDAKLLAYVIYKDGGVKDFTEIQAMEKAYLDSAQIIVITSAAYLTPYQPTALSEAIGNLAKLGVITVASAGNRADYDNIVIPAAFNDAIAVGATTVTDEIADYSSRGPNYNSIYIKPDIVAPAGLLVAGQNGFYIAEGTSISAPFLAGIIALMIEHDPNMSVTEIRSRLLNCAKDLGYDVWTQGSGRVDAYKALKVNLYLDRASYCMGYDDASKQEWIYRDTLIIFNDKTQNVSVNIQPIAVNGISSTFEMTSSNISAKSYLTVPFNIKVDNNVIPYPNAKIPSYAWKVKIVDDVDTLIVPFAFFKDRLLFINFSETPGSYFITNRQDNAWGDIWTVNNPTRLSLENGNYDLVTQFIDGSVTYTSVPFTDFAEIYVSKNVPLFPVTLTCYDETEGNILDNSSIYAGVYIINKLTGFGLAYETLANNINLSWFPDGYEIIVTAVTKTTTNNKLNYYDYKFSKNSPIDDKINFTSSVKNLKTIHHVVKSNSLLEPYLDNLQINWYSGQRYLRPIDNNSQQPMLETSYEINLRLELSRNKNEWYSYLFNETDGHPIYENGAIRGLDRYLSYLAGANSYKDSIYIRNWYGSYNTYKTDKTNIEVIHNGQAYIWLGNYYNELDKIILSTNITPGLAHDGFFFKSQYGDGFDVSYNYSLYKDNILVKNDSYRNGDLYHDPINISPGKYKMIFENTDYQIDNISGKVTVNSFFDTQKEDKNPPYFLTFGLYSNDEINSQLKRGTKNELKMNINDDYEIDSIIIRLITDTSFYSINLKVNNKNFVGNIAIPDSLKDGIYNLELSAIDNSGNELDYKASPFFIFGNVATSVDNTTTFTAIRQDKNIKLNWYTKSGSNIKEFDIERMLNAGVWQKINNILQKGVNYYDYTDDISKLMSNNISYRLKEIMNDSSYTYSTIVEVEGIMPLTYKLEQNYPNPFNPTTKISYSIPKESKVTLIISDILGRKIKTLVDKIEMPGNYNIIWDANKYSSGVYFYRIQSDNYIETKKMLLLR